MKKFILFDFDGVIGNTFPVALRAFNLLVPGIQENELRIAFEDNINKWIVAQKKSNNNFRSNINLSEEYGKLMQESAEIFPDMISIIKALYPSYSLAIISSNIKTNVEIFLEKYGLNGNFIEIFGSDMHDLKTVKINMLFNKYNTNDKNCIFVTDTSGDMLEAKEVGVSSIGVSWGFHSRNTLLVGDPYCIIDEPKDLPVAINSFFAISEKNSTLSSAG